MLFRSDHYDPQEFYSAVTGLENEPERGSRCTVCLLYTSAHDTLCKTLCNGGLANAGLTDQAGVVLGLTGQDADHVLSLIHI